jgi:hypothetical protein
MDADGNGMGDCLTALADAGASKEDYAAFSHLLSEATREALIEAATAVLLPVVGAQKNHIPLRVLMLGGDDVLVMALPQYILPLANEFCRRFQDIAARRKEELPSERKAVKDLLPLTMSAGVVIAHQKFPFLSFKRLGERLLKSAKRRAWQVKRKWLAWKEQGEQGQEPHRLTGSVDFQVITASGVDDLKTLREEAYTLRCPGEPKEIRLTGRPYLVSPERDELKDLRCALARMKAAKVSRGQMKGLHDVLRRGCQQGHMDFLRWFDRLRVSGRGTEQDARNQKAAICAVLGLPEDTLWPSPWQEDGSPKRPGGDNGKWFTPLLDVVELFDLPDDLAGDVKRKT